MKPGSRLGPYEIVAPLGAGGMGEVYRAIDTRLDRTVAIKVLPEHLAADVERRQRLEREARIVSSLDHANICALYDVGHEAGRDFLVIQYLDGETLAERLAKGALPVDRALTCAIEIAGALAAAHKVGIVHRDLKPANLMLTKSGVKVLDFGLARLGRAGNAAPNDVVTVSGAAGGYAVTEQGVVLGTVPYMAPEQVEGKPADARTDIFALGAVMFEMLTGRRAFDGGSPARTMMAILESHPPSVSSLRAGVSAAIDRVIHKCLAKGLDARWQTASDLADELKWLRDTDPASRSAPEATKRSTLRWTIVGGLVGLALAAATWAANVLLTDRPAPLAFTRLTYQRGTISRARFGPDGRTIVYSASWEGRPSDVFMTATGSPDSRALGLASAELLDVSRTGELAMLGPGGVLRVAPLTGARAPRPIADRVITAEWGPDGAAIAAIRAWDPQRSFTPLEFPLGQAFGGSVWNGSAERIRVAPDGRSIVVSETPIMAQVSRLTLVTITGETRDLGTWSSITGFCYRPDGQEIWVSGDRDGSGPGLWTVTPAGEARVLARFPAEPVLFDIAADGRALISTVERRVQMEVGTGTEKRDLSWLSASAVRGITDDGRTVLFEDVSDAPGAARSVWIRTTDGAPATRLGDGRPLEISPDGAWVAAMMTEPSTQLVLYPTGPGERRVIAEGGYDYPAATFLPDGRRLLLVETPSASRTDTPFRLKIADLASGALTSLAPEEGAVHVRHAIAPDGQSVLVKRQGAGFFVVPIDAARWRWSAVQLVPGLEEADMIRRWTRDGVYSMRFEPRALRIDRVQVPSGERTTWKQLAPADVAGISSPGKTGTFAVSADGRSYAYSYERTLSTLYLVEGLK
jgi:serine/threonine protein kinase